MHDFVHSMSIPTPLGYWLVETLASARTLGIALWVGLAFLTISLIVLMRTRWGQAKPLSKCAALSVFVHMLFMGYAYGTKLIFDCPVPPREPVFQLQLLETAMEASSDEQIPEAIEPWDQVALAANLVPAPADVHRLEIASAQQQRMQDELPVVAAAPAPEDLLQADPARPVVERVEVEPLARTAARAEPLKMDAPVASKQQAPTPLVTPLEEPRQRLETELPGIVAPERPAAPDLPSELVDVGARMQQLVDVPLNAEAADAVAAERDRAEQASNRDATELDSSGQLESEAARVAAKTSDDATLRRALDEASRPDQPVMTPVESPPPVTPRRLSDGEAVPEMYQPRLSGQRLRVAEQYGGNARTEAAVEAALAWLAMNQSADGHWDAKASGGGRETRVLGQDRQGAGGDADTGITGLALLAFLASGHTHLEGSYRQHVQHGLEYLLRQQRDDGSLAGPARMYSAMYCHGMATLALSEAYALTGDHRMKPYVERAVGFSIAAQHPAGGWRYQPGDQGDMSQFGWQVMALRSAQLAGIEMPAETHRRMLRFLQSTSGGAAGGLARYRPAERPSRTMTAEAMVCRVFLQADLPEAARREAIASLAEELPDAGELPNLYYWYYGTLALFQMQGEVWEAWNVALQQRLLPLQRADGELAGSWDPETVWGRYGGRVYSTAMATLCLQTYYRYLPLLR